MSLGGGGVDNAPDKEAQEEGEEDELTFDEPTTVLSGDRSKAAGTWAEAVVATVDQGGLSALHAAVFGGWDEEVALSPRVLLQLLLTVLRCEDEEMWGQPWACCSMEDDVCDVAKLAARLAGTAKTGGAKAQRRQQRQRKGSVPVGKARVGNKVAGGNSAAGAATERGNKRKAPAESFTFDFSDASGAQKKGGKKRKNRKLHTVET
jgi:hypothetical protein